MKISPSRIAAFDILQQIEEENAFSAALLPAYEAELSPADRALCHELVMGTLRRLMTLDRIIAARTGSRKIDTAVRTALRLAIYQLRHLDRVPVHSAVNESVNLVQRAGKSSAKAFVNGVLRGLIRDETQIEFADEMDRLSIETSHPRWLLEKWIGDFGFEKTSAIAHANNVQPPLAFRIICGREPLPAEIAGFAVPSEYVEGCYLSGGPQAVLNKLSESGDIYFQDEASQMVAQTTRVGEGERFLDVCASPGGKTAMIVRGSSEAGLFVAGDITERRTAFLRSNLVRQGITGVSLVRYDATRSLPFSDGAFDHVLVDAPCSGTGTIRHNPEIRYFLAEDLGRYSEKQLEILISASDSVRAGGLLTYSTCSFEKEENEAVVGRFLSLKRSFRIERVPMPDRFITDEGFARTWPDRDDMDGFFVAALRKT